MPETNSTTTHDSQPIGFLYEWNAEIMRFYLTRFQKCGTLPWRLTACQSPEETQEVQADFMAELAEDYRQEANRLSSIAGNLGEDAYTSRLLKAQEDAAAIIAQAKAQAEEILRSARERAGVATEKTVEPVIEEVKKSA